MVLDGTLMSHPWLDSGGTYVIAKRRAVSNLHPEHLVKCELRDYVQCETILKPRQDQGFCMQNLSSIPREFFVKYWSSIEPTVFEAPAFGHTPRVGNWGNLWHISIQKTKLDCWSSCNSSSRTEQVLIPIQWFEEHSSRTICC